ncbi:IscS subfamily cysteine desulfurase [Sporolactobacillus shoreicorticis]|uniref:IscS subfamily cysteine desulfurase n=1 Tax=Sporolactobacillus shoreicorticis TaxID=1923877 RepID=A0ABW5S1Z3_9BACL|nr:IscS subfamily cysteine desulfurase [Sporolactobacillus shoreicorticis]MCO7127860.1 IscS subfamily cysteine desulfurase [Sporolactobacillus shoreicorticis]
MIYLDYAATTPMSPKALKTYADVAQHCFGNTNSLHDFGDTAARLLSSGRKQMAQYLNVEENGVFFTSGGSESNRLAIEGLAHTQKKRGHHLIYVQGQHSSVVLAFEKLRKEGYLVTQLTRNESGEVTPAMIENAIREDTILVSVDHVNNEIGSITNIKAIGDLLYRKHIAFHCDAVQSFGKLPIDAEAAHITALSASAHKIFGPKGVALCFVDPRIALRMKLPRSAEPHSIRPGTVNLPGIAAFVTASKEAIQQAEECLNRVRDMRRRFISGIRGKGLSFTIEASAQHQLPHILAIRIPGIEGQQIMLSANRRGLAVATGSACSAASRQPSPTLLSIGRSPQQARELVRLSFGETTTEEELRQAIQLFSEAALEVQSSAQI